MRSTHIFILIAATAALLLTGACSGKKDKKDAQAQATPTVAVAEPEVDSVTLHREFPGFIQAATKVDVVARVNGTLRGYNYAPGQYVRKGQVLFTIESTTYADAVQRAQAALQTARSQRDYAAKRLTAMQKALASNAVSQMDVTQAQANLQQAEAAISTATAELRDARTQLGYCTVTAPCSGYITKPAIDPGNYVGGGMSPVTLASIYDSAKVTAEFSIDDNRFQSLIGRSGGEGAPMYRDVPLKFEEQLPHSYTADLYYTAPNVDQSTGTLLMRGEINNPYNDLKDGMYVSVELPYGTNPHAVLVRAASVSTDQRGKYLYVVDSDDKVQYRPVTVGQTVRDTLVIIDSGLQPGERYITDALLSVRPGMKVRPMLTR